MHINDPRDLALDLTARSLCRTKVAAVIWDAWGVVSWGWNHAGPEGLGQHAEHHALTRSNKARLKGAGIAVAAVRNGNMILARPCEDCLKRLKRMKVTAMFYTTKEGKWRGEPVG